MFQTTPAISSLKLDGYLHIFSFVPENRGDQGPKDPQGPERLSMVTMVYGFVLVQTYGMYIPNLVSTIQQKGVFRIV